MNTIKENISAIIPANNIENINEVINSLIDLVAEIIIINSSNNNLNFNDKKIKIYNIKNHLNASETRNLGYEKATNDYLLFIDSDVVLTQNGKKFIQNLDLSITNNEIIGGIYIIDDKANQIANINSLMLTYRFLNFKEYNENCEFISSSHFIISKKKFAELGLFNENLSFWEDVDLSVRARFLGNKLEIYKSFQAIHKKKYSFLSHFKEQIIKVFHASKIKFENFRMYKKFSGQLRFRLIIYLFLFPLFLITLSITKNIYLLSLISVIFLFAISIFNLKIFKNFYYSFLASIYLSVVSPILVLVNLLGKIDVIKEKIFISFLELIDFVICGFRILSKRGFPIQYIQYVTARCNLRCEHCFYKETLDKKDPGEISKELLVDTAQKMKPLLWYSMAGGEPFIRSDLGEIISEIQTKVRPKVFSLPTNGWYTNRTFQTTLQVLQKLKRGNFILFFSIDGDEKIHDEIRGKDSYKKLKETYAVLRNVSKMYSRLYLNIIITVQDKNYRSFPNLINQIYEEFQPTSISINLFRYHHKNAKKISPDIVKGYESAMNEYEKLRNKFKYKFIWNAIIKAKEKKQKDLILKVAKKDEFVTPCTAGNLSYVGMEDGSIKPCEILPDKMGNIYKQNDIKEIFRSKASKELRTHIVKSKCRCTYECAMSTNTLFNGDQQFGLIKQIFKDILPRKTI